VSTEELPLLAFFDELRTQAGLPLGVDEYVGLLQALQAGFGLQGEEDLRRLCYLLWTNNLQEQKVLDYYFDLMVGQRRAAANRATADAEIAAHPSPGEKSAADGASAVPPAPPAFDSNPSASHAVPPSSKPVPDGANQAASSAADGGAPVAAGIEARRHLESAIAQPQLDIDMVQAFRSIQASLQDQTFIFTGEYLPVTSRQMKQAWRHLRSLVRSGPRVVLNVPRTVENIACDGLLIEPVLDPLRTNRIEVLLLVDRKGSMVPFHLIAESLVESAQKGGRLAQAGAYYFYNLPRDCLYLTPALVKAEPLQAIYNRIHPDHTAVLIFSDAGAARGRINDQRVALTEAFIRHMNRFVRRAVWINPMPRDRWTDTSAEKIKEFIHMYEFSRQDLYRAIDDLRGRMVA
jgi:uncharacterized protein